MKKALYRYPETNEDDLVEDYHGTPVPAPFRWLEDPDNPETKAWTEAQNALKDGFLTRTPPTRRSRTA